VLPSLLLLLPALLPQGSRLSGEQLCELLPLVQEAELAVPVDWLQAALDKIQVGYLATELRTIWGGSMLRLGCSALLACLGAMLIYSLPCTGLKDAERCSLAL
jgi:hypothetical protein